MQYLDVYVFIFLFKRINTWPTRKSDKSGNTVSFCKDILGEGTITYIITEQQGLFNKLEQTQLEKSLTGLKPYTTYKVKVLSTNSHGKNESAFRILTFRTAEAGI